MKSSDKKVKMKKPIFIVGLHRSGSTLWANIIESSGNIQRFQEMYFLNSRKYYFKHFVNREIGNLSSENNIIKMVDLIFSNNKINGINGPFWNQIRKMSNPDLKKRLCNKLSESGKSQGEIFRILLEGIANYRGYNRFFVKFPVSLNHISKLLQWYPNSIIIHVTRDPRAIAMSAKYSKLQSRGTIIIKKHPYIRFIIERLRVLYSIIQYIETSKIHNQFKNHSNYKLFYYEDLLFDPEQVIQSLCNFSDIKYKKEMLIPREAQKSSITGIKTLGFDIKRATQWKKVITPFERKMITVFTKKSMKNFGYDYCNHPIFSHR